jgi:hypothetical protein
MPALEVADIFRRHGEAYRQGHAGHLGRTERRILGAIEACRTAALGGHVERCAECSLVRIAYNSCRNRHCPKCQGAARGAWLAERQAELLPVPYFHVVFTLPVPAAEIAFQNKEAVYAILFKAAAETLSTIAADRQHLGAEIGFIAVLHTWGQNLQHHPHVHCLVPGGGLALDGARWVSCRPGFFLPVRVLSRLFRRLFIEKLRAAFDAGRLAFFGALAGLADADAGVFARCLAELRCIEWVVYAKRPFAGPAAVLAYLGHYTHRVAIANSRLVTLAGGRVSFRWRDYRHHNKNKVMTLEADEFIRRFLLHALPDGFHRIRHYGFLSNRRRADKLALCRTLLAVTDADAPLGDSQERQRLADHEHDLCPWCGGRMEPIGSLPRSRPANPSGWYDSS